MLRLNNLGGYGGGSAEVDPNLAIRYLAHEFSTYEGQTGPIVDQYGNTLTLRGNGESYGASGLILPGNQGNGLDISRAGSYTTWPWNYGSGAHTIEFICALEPTASNQALAICYGTSGNYGWYISAFDSAPDSLQLGYSPTGTVTGHRYNNGAYAGLVNNPANKLHIAVTTQGSGVGGSYIHINGSLLVSDGGAAGSVFQVNLPLTLGCYPAGGGSSQAKGIVESVRGYSGVIYPQSNITPPPYLII